MSGLAPIAVLLVITGRFDVDGNVVVEARGGEGPVVTGPNSEPTVVSVLTPTVALHFDDHDLQLRLAYGPRISWSKSTDVPAGDPLILHVATLDARIQESSRLNLAGFANVSYGATDYAYLPQVFMATQATLPTPSKFVAATLGATVQLQATTNWLFRTTVEGIHRRPIDEKATTTADGAPNPQFVPFPRTTSVSLTPSLIGRLSRLDEMTFASGVTYQSTSTPTPGISPTDVPPVLSMRAEILTVTPTIGWRTHLSRRYDLHLAGGVAYHHIFASSSLARPSPITPAAAADVGIHLLSSQDVTIRATSGVVLDYFLDPILGTSGRRGLAFFRVLSTLPQSWSVGIDASFATSLEAAPVNATNPDETVASVALPVRHRASDHVTMEVGGRWSERAPHFKAPNFAFHQPQFWLYVLLTGTSRTVPAFRAP